MHPILPLNDKRYKPQNVCIYCGATNNLEDEHIIPYGIGGTAILPKASCRTCATITGRFEQKVLRGPMWAVRSYLNLKSRNPKDAPTKLPLEVIRKGNSVIEQLSLREHPLILQVPNFEPPGYMTSKKVRGINVRGVYTFNFGKPINDVLSDLKADDVRVTQNYELVPFAQMIAKIAWAMAAAENHLGKINPSPGVLRAIIEDPDDIGNWVGTFTDPRKRFDGTLHRIYISEDYDKGILLGEVQLFSSSGTPCYGVILGELL